MGLKRKQNKQKGPDTEAGDAPAEPAGGGRARGGRNIAVPVACLAVGALLGPKVLGTGDAAQAAPAGSEAAAPEVAELGPVVVLDPVTVNLGDGHLLKVGLALQLGADADHDSSGKGDSDDPTHGFAAAIDAAITALGRHSMAGLIDPAGRQDAKAELVEQVGEVTHGDVVDVYFHQFVMM